MDKKAGGDIWLPFLQFLSNFNETLSISLFFQGRFNRALRSDLTPLHSTHFTTAQRALCTDFPTFLFFKLESCNLVCRREFGFRKHSYTVFFTNQGACSAYFALHSAHFAPFFQLFCFSSKRAVIWRASVNLNFVNILILYFLAIRVCTAHILHRFPNFFVFQAKEL